MDIEIDFSKSQKICDSIETNCQFLTNIKRCMTQKQQLIKNTHPILSQYLQNKQNKLYYEGFAQVLIQIAYLIFSCKHFNVKPEITKDDVRVEEIVIKAGEKRYCPVIFYKIQHFKPLEPHQSINILTELYKYLLNSFEVYCQHFQGEFIQIDTDYRNTIKRFGNQFKFLDDHKTCFEANVEKQMFLCLEETNLFDQYSTLLKIKNSSILDIIKSTEANFIKFKTCKKQDVNLVNEYTTEKRNMKSDHEGFKKKQIEIDENISNFFQTLNNSLNYMQFEPFANKNQKENLSRVKFVYKIKQKQKLTFSKAVRVITNKLPEFIEEELTKITVQPSNQSSEQMVQKANELEYHIEYSSDRNSINVKLVTSNVHVNVETSDFLMFQSNVLTFDAANVSIELCETKAEKGTKKVVAFKGVSCFKNKQPQLEKILLLMDIIMISSKIYEPELNPAKSGQHTFRDYHSLNLISKKVNHYTKMFLKCSKKVYQELT